MINKKLILTLTIFLSLVFIALLILIIRVNSSACFGYLDNGVCYSIGDEVRKDGNYYYIDQNGDLRPQKADGASCQNNVECLNNLCSDNVCVDIYKEAKKSTDLTKEAEERSRNLQLGYDVSISIQTKKDTYNRGEIIKLN